MFCRRAFDLGERPDWRAEDFWPRPSLEPSFRRVCLAHEALILPVMQALLLDLGCTPHLYDRRLTRTNFGQRLNYYPPLRAGDEASGAGRLLGHEDVDLFTFLPAPRLEGLQVLNRANMTTFINVDHFRQGARSRHLPAQTAVQALAARTEVDAALLGGNHQSNQFSGRA